MVSGTQLFLWGANMQSRKHQLNIAPPSIRSWKYLFIEDKAWCFKNVPYFLFCNWIEQASQKYQKRGCLAPLDSRCVCNGGMIIDESSNLQFVSFKLTESNITSAIKIQFIVW